MNSKIYEILESFKPFEKLKKSQSQNYFKPSNATLYASKSSQNLTNFPISITTKSAYPTKTAQEIETLKKAKQKLVDDLTLLQIKRVKTQESLKTVKNKEKTLKIEENALVCKQKRLFTAKSQKESVSKELQRRFLARVAEFKGKVSQKEALEIELTKLSEITQRNLEEISSKISKKRSLLETKQQENCSLSEKYHDNFQEIENFSRLHNVFSLKSEIAKSVYELQFLENQLEILKKDFENSSFQAEETKRNLLNEISLKTTQYNSMKTDFSSKRQALEAEFSLLTSTFLQKKLLKTTYEESLRGEKASFLKQMKQLDDEKLALFREQARKKDANEHKYNRFLDIFKQKTREISYKRVSQADVEIEEMKQSRISLKTSYESELSEKLLRKEAVRNSNNELSERLQEEKIKKSRFSAKLARLYEEKAEKETSLKQILKETRKNQALCQKLQASVQLLEKEKCTKTAELQKLLSFNEDLRKNLDSIEVLKVSIEEKKREKQWFIDIKREISAQKDASAKKVKEMRKFAEKTQKELKSQQELLEKFQKKIDNLDLLAQKLQNKRDL